MSVGELLGGALRTFVAWLEAPTMAALLTLGALAIVEVGLAIGERLRGLRQLTRHGDVQHAFRVGQRRIERADLYGRVGPMLGLMGTLIPLGPGLAALGEGDLASLASAVTVAFDTTVAGMAIGIVGFVLGRFRRRWYDRLLETLEARDQEEANDACTP